MIDVLLAINCLSDPFSGGSADWAKGVANIKYSYLLEIRDDGRYGFLLPPEQIVPTGEEHWAGVRIIAEEILRNYGRVNSPEVVNQNNVEIQRIVLLSGSEALAVGFRLQCIYGIVTCMCLLLF